MAIVISDPHQADNPIVMANQAFLDLTGYGVDEVLGHNCRFLQGKDTNPADVEVIRHGLASRADRFSVELLNYRKDGSSFWNQLVVSPVFDDAGDLLYYFSSQQDVTAIRHAREMEATERLLLMEVDHRALNALALVQSIVRQARGATVSAHSELIIGRVDALARAHRLMAEAGWSGADLGELIAGEIADTRAGRVSVEGPKTHLSPRLVQPLALVLHELMLNAMMHGALATSTGRVTLNWDTIDNRLHLTWQEHGVDSIVAPTQRGMGLSMLTGIVERQLNGGVITTWDAPGLSANIELPVGGRGSAIAKGVGR